MYTTYILYSDKLGKKYVGFTSDLESRLVSHNHPNNTGFTKAGMPWRLIHVETFDTKKEAMDREKFLKTGHGRDWMKANLKY